MKPSQISILIASFFLVLLGLFGSAQVGAFAADPVIPFNSNRWEITAKNSKLETYLGKPSIFFSDGFAVVKDSEFTDGIIEYDIAFTGERGFMGAVWHLQDLKNYEKLYMRAHQSGNREAIQYTPYFNGVTAWQLYFGDGYIAPFKFTLNQWMHVKIIVSGNNAEVYVNDMDKPLLFLNDLKRDKKSGKVGLVVEEFAPAHFANFSYTSMKNPPIKGKPKEIKDAPAGTIMSWLVSNTFEEKLLDGKIRLTEADKKNLTWDKLQPERSGLTNLARVHGVGKEKTSVFARATILSDKDQVKSLDFGFSDRIKIYLNDQLLYSGHDEFMSRDYKFQGTIGYYDTLYLPLKKGKNELWLAVSEGPANLPVGGWGVQAKFENLEGISIAK